MDRARIVETATKAWRFAIHEAGHAVAGESLDRRVAIATIKSGGAIAGFVDYEDRPTKNSSRLICTVAGTVAEGIAFGSGPLGHDDLYSAIQFAEQAFDIPENAGMTDAQRRRAAMNHIEGFAMGGARKILCNNWNQVEAVATALLRGVTLTGEDVRRAIRAAPPGGRPVPSAPVQLEIPDEFWDSQSGEAQPR